MSEKKLYKSRDDKYIGGVCGGIGEYFEIDSTIIRLAAILLSFATSGVLVLIYILLCFLIPYEPIISYTMNDKYGYNKNTYSSYDMNNMNINPEKGESRKQKNLGVFLVIIGSILFLGKILPDFLSRFIVPIGLLIAGIFLIVSAVPVSSDKNMFDDEKSGEDDLKENTVKEDGTEDSVNEEENINVNLKENEVVITGSDDIDVVKEEEIPMGEKRKGSGEYGEFTVEEIIKMREEGNKDE